MAIVTFRKLLGGIIKDYVNGNTAAVEGRANQYSRTSGIDLFRQGFVGHFTPAQVFTSGAVTDASSNINSLARNVATDVRPLTTGVYYITGGLSGTAPRVVKTSLAAYDSHNVISAHGGHNFTTIPSGTGFWGEDVVAYKANVGGTPKTCIFYSWNDSVDGDVGRYDIDGAAYDDDFMSAVASGGAVLTTNVPHIFKEGPDKILYCTNGQYVASFDGATGNDGTYRAQAYDLGAGWLATDLSVQGNYLVISAVKAGSFNYFSYMSESKVCFWDGVEPGLGIVYEIPDNFISSMLETRLGLLLFTTGKNGTAKIMDLKGRVLPGAEWKTALYGTAPKPNQAEVYQDNIVWSAGDNLGGFVMGYSQEHYALHLPMLAANASTTSTTTGFLKNVEGANLYCSMLLAGSYKVQYTNGDGGYASEVNLRTGLVRLPFKANITKVRVYFSQMASGSSAQFSLFKNYATMSVGGADDRLNKTVSYASNGALTEKEFANLNIIGVSAFYMNFLLTGQISIAMVEVEYQPSR